MAVDVSCETLVELCDIMFSLKWVAVSHQDVSCETLNGVARFALAVFPMVSVQKGQCKVMLCSGLFLPYVYSISDVAGFVY